MDSIFEFLTTLSYWALTIYEWILIISILLSWVHPDPSNPIVSFVNNMTRPVWNWLTLFLPSSLKLFAAYISLLCVWFLKIFVPGVIASLGAVFSEQIGIMDFPVSVVGFFLLGVGIVMQNLLFFLMILLLVWFVLTLVNPAMNNPIVQTVYMLVDPLITPVQKWLPRSKVDLSPLVAAGGILLVNLFVIPPLINLAVGLTQSGLAMKILSGSV